jgi:hypothetical protein
MIRLDCDSDFFTGIGGLVPLHDWYLWDSHVVGCDSCHLAVAKGTAHMRGYGHYTHAWLNGHECVETSVVTHSLA